MKISIKILSFFCALSFCAYSFPIKLLVEKGPSSTVDQYYTFSCPDNAGQEKGYCMIAFDTNTQKGELKSIKVVPSERGKGLGSTLLTVILKFFKKQQIYYVKVLADPEDDGKTDRLILLQRTISFYKKFGFTMFKDENGNDRYIYHRETRKPQSAWMALKLDVNKE